MRDPKVTSKQKTSLDKVKSSGIRTDGRTEKHRNKQGLKESISDVCGFVFVRSERT